MIKVNFVNSYQFDFKPKKVIKNLAKAISVIEKVKGKHYLSIIIVDNEEIHRINKEYRHIDRPTDVISFALGDGEDNLPVEMGDIFISYDKILEQANEYGHSVKREFAFLACHGMHHLLGYDHMTTEDEKVMFGKQDYVLDFIGIGRK